MTAHHLATILHDLAALGLTKEHLARLHGYRSATSIRQMLAGKQSVPDDMAAWLRRLHAWWIANRR